MSNLAMVLLIVLLMLAIGAFPIWPHAAAWGPYPGGALLVLLVLVLVLAIAGKL